MAELSTRAYNCLDKVDARRSSYLATVGIENGKFLSELRGAVAGMSCVSNFDKSKYKELQSVRSVGSLKNLDSNIFDRVIAQYSSELSFKELVRVAEDFGKVLIQGISKEQIGGLIRLLNNRGGIFETWTFGGYNGTIDLLFRVRKYGVTNSRQ